MQSEIKRGTTFDCQYGVSCILGECIEPLHFSFLVAERPKHLYHTSLQRTQLESRTNLKSPHQRIRISTKRSGLVRPAQNFRCSPTDLRSGSLNFHKLVELFALHDLSFRESESPVHLGRFTCTSTIGYSLGMYPVSGEIACTASSDATPQAERPTS